MLYKYSVQSGVSPEKLYNQNKNQEIQEASDKLLNGFQYIKRS
jgi:hypothetical protein